MADGPRLIRKVIANCDECPLRQLRVRDDEIDDHWLCTHWDGQFTIAEVGTAADLDRFGDSVVGRLGQAFPERCPLPPVEGPLPSSTAVRTRVIDLPETGT